MGKYLKQEFGKNSVGREGQQGLLELHLGSGMGQKSGYVVLLTPSHPRQPGSRSVVIPGLPKSKVKWWLFFGVDEQEGDLEDIPPTKYRGM